MFEDDDDDMGGFGAFKDFARDRSQRTYNPEEANKVFGTAFSTLENEPPGEMDDPEYLKELHEKANAARESARTAGKADMRSIFPKKEWARVRQYLPRGTPEGIRMFGETSGTANAEQSYNRGVVGWHGHGQYNQHESRGGYGRNPQTYSPYPTYAPGVFFTGNGSFWTDIWDGVKSAAGDVWNGVKDVGEALLPHIKEAGKHAIHKGISEGLPHLIEAASGFMGGGKYLIPTQMWEDILRHPEGQEFVQGIVSGKYNRIEAAPGCEPLMESYMPMTSYQPMGKRPRIEEDPRNAVGSGIGRYGNPQYSFNNIINPGSSASKKPIAMHSAQDETGDVIISYYEYIQPVQTSADATGTNSFETIAKLELNPGMVNTFPLLSQFAGLYEEYDFEKMVFHFKSNVTAGNSTSSGEILMVNNTNPGSSVCTDSRSMLNSSGAVSTIVTGDAYLGVECQNRKTIFGGTMYVRTQDIPRDQRKTYDYGFVQIAAVGVPPGTNVGSLFVEYTIRLKKITIRATPSVDFGDGMFLSVVGGPTNDPSLNGQNPFLGVTFPATDSGGTVALNAPLHLPSGWTACQLSTITGSLPLDTYGSNIQMTFPFMTGQKYLFRYVGTFNDYTTSSMAIDISASHSSEPLITTMISGHYQSQVGVETIFPETVVVMILCDFRMSTYIEKGIYQLNYAITHKQIGASRCYGSSVSVVRVPYDYVLPTAAQVNSGQNVGLITTG